VADPKQQDDRRDATAFAEADRRAVEERAAANARRHSASMQALGLKPFDPPLPDPEDPEFQAQVRRACEIINSHPEEKKILAELELWFDDEGGVYDWE
jgi:hypothetical protein